MIEAIDEELHWIRLLAELTGRADSRSQQGHEFLDAWDALAVDVRYGEDGADLLAGHGLGVDANISIIALGASWDRYRVLTSLRRLQNFC